MLEWNDTMQCFNPSHLRKNGGKPFSVTRLRFNRKCGKHRKDNKICRWLRYEVTKKQKIVDEINKKFSLEKQ